MFGRFVGRIAAAPARIISVGCGIMDLACGERKPHDNVFDDIAETVEKKTAEIFDGKKK
jgi:hypothetical protein